MPAPDYELMKAIREEKRLRSLHRKLTFGASSVGFLWVLFWFPIGPVLLLLVAGGVAFLPYLMISLLRLRRTGWIIAITILVLIPLAASVISGAPHLLGLLPGFKSKPMPSGVAGYFLWMAPLIGLYVCAFLLRHSVGLWLEEATWTRKDKEQIRRSAARREVDTESRP